MTEVRQEVASAPLVAPEGELRARSWAYRTRPVAALDHHFTVRTSDAVLGRYLESILAGFPATDEPATVYSLFECPDQPGSFALYVDNARVRLTSTPWLVLADLMWHVNRRTVELSSDYVLVHAAAAERDGVGVLLPAAMESGKTTLVAGLVQRGFRYLTDEAAALHPRTLLIHPYPKPLSIDRGSWDVLSDLAPVTEERLAPYVVSQWQVPVTAIRPDAVAAPTAPRLVITPRYGEGAVTEVTPLPRTTMLKVLAENTFHFRSAARRNLAVLAHALRRSDCYQLAVGDLDEACAAVEELVCHVRTDRRAP